MHCASHAMLMKHAVRFDFCRDLVSDGARARKIMGVGEERERGPELCLGGAMAAHIARSVARRESFA